MGNENKLTKNNAISFLEDQGFVVLPAGQFKRLNGDFNKLRGNVETLSEQVNTLPESTKGVSRFRGIINKFEAIFERWGDWFSDNGGEEFESGSGNRISSSRTTSSSRTGSLV